jgi:hypothetical protein
MVFWEDVAIETVLGDVEGQIAPLMAKNGNTLPAIRIAECPYCLSLTSATDFIEFVKWPNLLGLRDIYLTVSEQARRGR